MSAAAVLVFARCIGFASRAPGLSHPSVPGMVRVIVGCALASAVVPSVRGVHVPGGGAMLACSFVGEVLFGVAIGQFAALLYDAAYAGGRVVDDYAGVRAIAPSAEMVAPSGFGRIWSIAFTGGFFLFGAYRIAILAFADTFRSVPPGAAVSGSSVLAYAGALGETMMLAALAVAGPAVALAFVVQVALAAVSRAVPRLGGVTLVSPFVFAAAIVATAVSLPALEGLAAHPYVHAPLATAAR
jgi:flagellar biosynthetic protein FliR